MGTMSIGNWIIQNIGYKNIALYKKKCILTILQNKSVLSALELGITRFCDGLDGLIRDTVFISVFVRPFYTVTVSRQYRF